MNTIFGFCTRLTSGSGDEEVLEWQQSAGTRGGFGVGKWRPCRTGGYQNVGPRFLRWSRSGPVVGTRDVTVERGSIDRRGSTACISVSVFVFSFFVPCVLFPVSRFLFLFIFFSFFSCSFILIFLTKRLLGFSTDDPAAFRERVTLHPHFLWAYGLVVGSMATDVSVS